MSKILLQSADEYQAFIEMTTTGLGYGLKPTGYALVHNDPPTHYPCVAVYEVCETYQGWSFNVEFVYLADFEE